jgi:hypothetical protein
MDDVHHLATVFIEKYFQILQSSVDSYNNLSREELQIVFQKRNIEQDIYELFYSMSQ